MSRRLLGYRVRGMRDGKRVHLNVSRWVWSDAIPSPYANRSECVRVADATKTEVGVSDVRIVAVYLRTVLKAPIDRTLSSFNGEVVAEIDRRGIDAFAEPEDFGAMPTTLRFRTPNGGFVWVPILAFSVVEGPKEERAKRTVDRMLEAIASLASSLSGKDKV